MKALALLAITGTLLIGPAPARADWDLDNLVDSANDPTGKVVEVVNKMPASWEVGAAVRFVDKYTTSRVRFVKKCSATAWRCVLIKPGSIKGAPLGWHKNGTITIDVAEANRLGYGRSAAFRKYLISHEFGHNRGLPHSSGRNIMYQYAKRNGTYLPLFLNHDQRLALKKS